MRASRLTIDRVRINFSIGEFLMKFFLLGIVLSLVNILVAGDQQDRYQPRSQVLRQLQTRGQGPLTSLGQVGQTRHRWTMSSQGHSRPQVMGHQACPSIAVTRWGMPNFSALPGMQYVAPDDVSDSTVAHSPAPMMEQQQDLTAAATTQMPSTSVVSAALPQQAMPSSIAMSAHLSPVALEMGDGEFGQPMGLCNCDVTTLPCGRIIERCVIEFLQNGDNNKASQVPVQAVVQQTMMQQPAVQPLATQLASMTLEVPQAKKKISTNPRNHEFNFGDPAKGQEKYYKRDQVVIKYAIRSLSPALYVACKERFGDDFENVMLRNPKIHDHRAYSKQNASPEADVALAHRVLMLNVFNVPS